MAEADFLESICDPISDDTRIRELREDVSRMCRNENVYNFPGRGEICKALTCRLTTGIHGSGECEVFIQNRILCM